MEKYYFRIENYRPSRFAVRAADLTTAFSVVATAHAQNLGILHGFEADRDCGWVILTTNLRIFEIDPLSEIFTLETWVAAIEGALFVREFRVSYSTPLGERRTIAEAAQSYVLFDRKRRRPLVIPRVEREKLKGLSRQFSFQLKLDRRATAVPNAAHARHALVFKTVQAKDIDLNGHLNNSVYLEWMSPWIDPISLDRGGTYEIAIEFLREASLGDRMKLRGHSGTESSDAILMSESGEVSAIGKAISH